MAISNQKNSIYYQIDNTKDVVPESVTKTGTITTVGKNVTGIGTLFLSELKPGDWIVDIVTNNEVRKVDKIRDNLFLTLDSGFSADLAGATLEATRTRAKQISIANVGGADATIDGSVMEIGETVNFPKSNKNPNGSDFIDPLIVNATGTRVKVSITK